MITNKGGKFFRKKGTEDTPIEDPKSNEPIWYNFDLNKIKDVLYE